MRSSKEIICGIYKITNLVNNKVYIGQSNDINRRWKEHEYSYINPISDTLLYKAMRKYGIHNFKFEILEECDVKDLDELEINYIKQYKSYIGVKNCNGYNMTLGGQGNNNIKRRKTSVYIPNIQNEFCLEQKIVDKIKNTCNTKKNSLTGNDILLLSILKENNYKEEWGLNIKEIMSLLSYNNKNCLSPRTVRNVLNKLIDKKYIIKQTGQKNTKYYKLKSIRTNLYTIIDYKSIEECIKCNLTTSELALYIKIVRMYNLSKSTTLTDIVRYFYDNDECENKGHISMSLKKLVEYDLLNKIEICL